MTERTALTTANGGREYEVVFDDKGRAVRVSSVIVQCNGETRTRRFWKAGQPMSLVAACAVRAAQGKPEKYSPFPDITDPSAVIGAAVKAGHFRG
jgi:hypothetical protein